MAEPVDIQDVQSVSSEHVPDDASSAHTVHVHVHGNEESDREEDWRDIDDPPQSYDLSRTPSPSGSAESAVSAESASSAESAEENAARISEILSDRAVYTWPTAQVEVENRVDAAGQIIRYLVMVALCVAVVVESLRILY